MSHLMAVFQVSPVPPWLSSSAPSKTEPLSISGTGFLRVRCPFHHQTECKHKALTPTSGPASSFLHPPSDSSVSVTKLFSLVLYYYNYPPKIFYKCSAIAEMADHLATIDMDQKWGAVPLIWEVRTESPSNTMWPGPRSTFVLPWILIHPAVWPK